MGEYEISEQPRQNATPFDLSIDQLPALKKAGRSPEIIEMMANLATGTGETAAVGSTKANDPNWPSGIPD